MEDSINKIRNLILEGLTTDGSHHKQWYLEELLKFFCRDIGELRNKYEWEDGIAP